MRDILQTGNPLFCDLYHLTMAQAWFADNKHNQPKTSEAFFRKTPFGGGYLLAAGLGEFLQWAENWKFGAEELHYLSGLKDARGEPMFRRDFLQFLKNEKLRVNIQAVPEGEIVFPNEPVVSICGPNWQVEMMEAAFLNIFNSQSLIATKAARIVEAARCDGVKRPVLEFGVRRAQELGSLTAARAAFIGGCSGTSDVLAGQYYNIPVKGTMAHSFVMSYENEVEAFKVFLRSFPGNAILLPDTYDTRQGIKNTITASRETGVALMGARIDSGDLAYWYKEGRRLYDEAGMPQVQMVASNDLDEYLIENMLLSQEAKYDVFAAGTKLVTAYDTPALGGVFKTKQFAGLPKIKIAEGKTTIPGATNVMRMLDNGMFNGDVIIRSGGSYCASGRLGTSLISYNLNDSEEKKLVFAAGSEVYPLLKTVMLDGQIISDDHHYSLQEIQKTAENNLKRLDKAYKRLYNPHHYGIGLESGLYQQRRQMIRNFHKTGEGR